MILPESDALLHEALMRRLIQYAVEHDEEIAGWQAASDAESLVKMRERMFGSVELIEGCAAAAAEALKPDELATLRGFRHAVMGRFVVERFLKAGAIFIAEESPPRVFRVLGIRDSVEEVLWQAPPIMVQAVLLPFRGRVVHDGILLSYPIRFGGGFRRAYKEDYLRAKQQGRIIAAPAPDGSWPEPVAKATPPHRASEAEEIVTLAAKLEGGSSVQRDAFALLRAAAALAAAAASEPDELDDLEERASAVDRALARARRGIDRARP